MLVRKQKWIATFLDVLLVQRVDKRTIHPQRIEHVQCHMQPIPIRLEMDVISKLSTDTRLRILCDGFKGTFVISDRGASGLLQRSADTGAGTELMQCFDAQALVDLLNQIMPPLPRLLVHRTPVLIHPRHVRGREAHDEVDVIRIHHVVIGTLFIEVISERRFATPLVLQVVDGVVAQREPPCARVERARAECGVLHTVRENDRLVVIVVPVADEFGEHDAHLRCGTEAKQRQVGVAAAERATVMLAFIADAFESHDLHRDTVRATCGTYALAIVELFRMGEAHAIGIRTEIPQFGVARWQHVCGAPWAHDRERIVSELEVYVDEALLPRFDALCPFVDAAHPAGVAANTAIDDGQVLFGLHRIQFVEAAVLYGLVQRADRCAHLA